MFPRGTRSVRIVLYSHLTVPLLTYELRYAECSGDTLMATYMRLRQKQQLITVNNYPLDLLFITQKKTKKTKKKQLKILEF